MYTPNSLASRRTAGVDATRCGSIVGLSSLSATLLPSSSESPPMLLTGWWLLLGSGGAAVMSGVRAGVLRSASACSAYCSEECASSAPSSSTTVAPCSSVPSATLRSRSGSPTYLQIMHRLTSQQAAFETLLLALHCCSFDRLVPCTASPRSNKLGSHLHHVARLMVQPLHGASEARRNFHGRLVAGHLAQLLELLDLISDGYAPRSELALLDACGGRTWSIP